MTSLLSGIFFLSGAAALIFETLWFHETGIAFGNSVWGAALVLAGFMAGLALGNYAVARYGTRISMPVRFYAILEIAIAVFGTTLVYLLPRLSGWLAPLFSPFLEVPYVLNALRLFIAFVLLVIPTTAMGATLPLLVRALSRINPNFGWALGRLYGWNTIGAVAGVLVAEIVLVKWWGISGAAKAAGSLNLVAAALAMYAAKVSEGQGTIPVTGPDQRPEPGSIPLTGKRILLAAFIFGGIMLALEVLWFRFLLLVRDGTTLIFAVMLAITLSGISLGGLAASRWCRQRPDAHTHLPELSLASGALVVATYWGFDWAFQAVNGLTTYTMPVFVVVSLQLVFPVAFTSGLLFTLLGHALKASGQESTRAAGLLTLANTTGGLCGSLLAAFMLLPKLGVESSFFLMALAYGTGAIVIPRASVTMNAGRRSSLAFTAAVFAGSLVLFPFGLMESSYYSITEQRFSMREDLKIVAVREGLSETVFYLRNDRFGRPFYYRLITNGFGMASTSTQGRRFMKLFVYWPVAVHPEANHALLISYGMGNTAKALTDTSGLETIDIVDISRDVLEMSDILYRDPAGHPLHDPRVRVFIEDGRFFLQTTDRKYDLITAEPPPPNLAGIVNLYSQEYFELVRDRLLDGGVVTYWLPSFLLHPTDCLAIIKGFCNAFEDCSLWSGAGLNWMLVGTRQARGPVSRQHFSKQWSDPVVARELHNLGFETPAQLGSLFMADAEFLRSITSRHPPLTDDFPQRVSTRQRSYNRPYSPLYARLMDHDAARSRFSESELVRRLWPPDLVRQSLPYFTFERSITLMNEPAYLTQEDFVWDHLHSILRSTSLRTLVLWLLDSSQEEQEMLDEVISEGAWQPQMSFLLASRAIADRDYSSAAQHLSRYLKSGSPVLRGQAYKLRLYMLLMAGEKQEALRYAGEVSDSIGTGPGASRYWDWIARTFKVELPPLGSRLIEDRSSGSMENAHRS